MDKHDVVVIDACVTGGAARAAQKQLTLLVGGDADALIPLASMIRTWGKYPEGTGLHMWHGVGHSPNIDCPDGLAEEHTGVAHPIRQIPHPADQDAEQESRTQRPELPQPDDATALCHEAGVEVLLEHVEDHEVVGRSPLPPQLARLDLDAVELALVRDGDQ